MKLILKPLILNKKQRIESIMTPKFLNVEGKLIPVTADTLQEIARAYFKEKREEITKDKINDFIANF